MRLNSTLTKVRRRVVRACMLALQQAVCETPTSLLSCGLALTRAVCMLSRVQVACAFSNADAATLTSIDIRRSFDPGFAAGVTITYTRQAAQLATSQVISSTPSVAYEADDVSSPAPVLLPVYFSMRANSAGGVGAWSTPFAAVDGRAAVFASPRGVVAATGVACGTYSTPCSQIADALTVALPNQPVLLLPGNFSGPGNRGLSMNGQVRMACAMHLLCPSVIAADT